MSRTVSRRADAQEIQSEYHRRLIDGVPDDCVFKTLSGQIAWQKGVWGRLSPEQIDVVHPPYRWTIRQVVEHCSNAERVFGYRIMRFAAGDAVVLPGWDQDQSANSRFGLGNFGQLTDELELLRRANLLLLRRIAPKAWDRVGDADGVRLSVRVLAWVMAGHLRHHLKIIEARCGFTVSS